MQYSEGIDESRRYLRLTLEMIGKYGLPTDPLNYCIWYEYVSGSNEELKVAIGFIQWIGCQEHDGDYHLPAQARRFLEQKTDNKPPYLRGDN